MTHPSFIIQACTIIAWEVIAMTSLVVAAAVRLVYTAARRQRKSVDTRQAT